MRAYLTGQRWFGVEVLDALRRRGVEVVGIAAPVDDRLAAAATRYRIPLLPSGQLRAAAIPEGTDLIVAAHSHDFVGRLTRERARFGAIGYHPSLLPLHRGRSAVEWTVRMRDRVSGGTWFWLNDTVDGGPVAAQAHAFVRPDDTARSLWRRELGPLGVELLDRVLADLHSGIKVAVPQNPDLATWEPSLGGHPRLYRPELAQLSDGRELSYEIDACPDALRRGRRVPTMESPNGRHETNA